MCEICTHKGCIQCAGKCGVFLPVANQLYTNGQLGLNSPNDQLWFAGEMDRITASKKLEKRENGTFLVRIRPQSDENDKYAVTLK